MYINTLPNNCADNLLLYADVTSFLMKEDNIIKLSERILRILSVLDASFTGNGLKLNNQKTKTTDALFQ